MEERYGWKQRFPEYLSDTSVAMLQAVIDYADGFLVNDYDRLACLNDDVGDIFVLFDAAVQGEIKAEEDGEIRTKNVLILVSINHWLARKHVDLNACSTEEEREDCLPTQAKRYKDAYDGLMEEWDKNATGEQKRPFARSLAQFRLLKNESTEVLFAIGGIRFPAALQTFCKQQGYLCIVPKGTGFVVT